MQQLNIKCDIKLKVDDELIQAHKLVLCSVSPYFRAMFNTEVKETVENIITFHDVTMSILRGIVHFIYTGEIEINETNVFDLMKSSHLYQISAIQPAISQYLLKSLNTNNCLQSLAHAKLYGYEEVISDILKFVEENFHFVVNKDIFLHCPENVVNLILRQKNLEIESMFHALGKWLKYNSKSTYDVQLFEGDKFVDHLLRIKFIEKNHIKHKDLFLDLKDILLRKLFLFDSVQELCDVLVEKKTIFAVGGSSEGYIMQNTECYINEMWSKWIPKCRHGNILNEELVIVPKMLIPRMYFGFAYREYDMFVLGGTDNFLVYSSCERYNIITNEWQLISPLPTPKKSAAATMVNNVLHITGGIDSDEIVSKEVWEYYEKGDRWISCKPMQQQRYYHGACSVRGVLYVMGGSNQDDEILSSIERYDNTLRRWTYVCEMPEPKSEFGCVVFNEYIYVIGGARKNFVLSSVHRYNTLTNKWELCADMPAPKCGFGCTVKEDRIYCLGGSNLVNGPQSSAEYYNPDTNRWHYMRNNLTVPRAYAAAAVLNMETVHEKYLNYTQVQAE
ncbi:uncharacterized protein CBL_11773 [Carabus blaptoides fortunei]